MEYKSFKITDRSGNAVNGALVTVYDAGTNTEASGLKDAAGQFISATGLESDASGRIAFFAPNGEYDLSVSASGGDLSTSLIKVSFYDAEDDVDNAAAQAALAKQWASDPEDSEVAGGEYSAKHYAAKAQGYIGQVPLFTEPVYDTGDGTARTVQLTDYPLTADYVDVYFDGVHQRPEVDWTFNVAGDASRSITHTAPSGVGVTIRSRGLRSAEAVDSAGPTLAESIGLAEAASDKAQDWANEAEDVEVETGLYSAKHWAAKAEESATNASGFDPANYYDKTESDARFATAAQGALADSALQPGDVATVATTGAYSDLTGTPTLGTAADNDEGDFATAAQGATADAALPASGGTLTGGITETPYTLAGSDIATANGNFQEKTLAADATMTATMANGDTVVVTYFGMDTYTVTHPAGSVPSNNFPTEFAPVQEIIYRKSQGTIRYSAGEGFAS